MIDTCPTCGEFVFKSLQHRCKPIWYVRLDWHEKGDERKVHSYHAPEAAEIYCDRHDKRGDYEIIGEGEARVIVYDANMVLVGMYEIEAESVPSYHATEARLSDDERKVLEHSKEQATP